MSQQLSIFRKGPDGVEMPTEVSTTPWRSDGKVILSNFLLNGQFRLNTVEWRLFFSMIACIPENAKSFQQCWIQVRDIIAMAGLKTGDHLYAEIDRHIKGLMSHVVSWEKSPGVTKYANLINNAEYHRGHGVVMLEPHQDLVPHLLNLKKEFTSAELTQCLRFSSPYTSRIYMLLKQFDSKDSGWRTMSIPELRFKLTLDYTDKIGKKEVSQSIFPTWSEMRVNIIEKAQKELLKSDIPFEYEPITAGRKVVAVKFILKGGKRFKANQPQLTEPTQMSETQAVAYGRLNRLGFTDFQCRQIMERANLQEIHKVAYEVETQSWNAAGKPISNKSAYAYGIFKKKFGID